MSQENLAHQVSFEEPPPKDIRRRGLFCTLSMFLLGSPSSLLARFLLLIVIVYAKSHDEEQETEGKEQSKQRLVEAI